LTSKPKESTKPGRGKKNSTGQPEEMGGKGPGFLILGRGVARLLPKRGEGARKEGVRIGHRREGPENQERGGEGGNHGITRRVIRVRRGLTLMVTVSGKKKTLKRVFNK